MVGDRALSLQRYRQFVAMWSFADDDLPILQEARREYSEIRMKE
jgi:hypothetical protein